MVNKCYGSALHPDRSMGKLIKFNMKPIPVPPKQTIRPKQGKSYLTRDGTRVVIIGPAKQKSGNMTLNVGYSWQGLTECGKKLTWTETGYFLRTKEIDGMDIVKVAK